MLKILLVDDNPDDRFLTIRELRREYPDVHVVQVTDEAVFRRALQEDTFDAVITDFQLRWTTGLEVLKRCKEFNPDLPVIMFTATGDEEVAVQAMKAGLDDYVLKSPKHFGRLPMTVRAAIERAEARRRAREAEEAMRRRARLLQALNNVILEANKAEDLRDFLERVLDATLDVLDVPVGTIWVMDENGQQPEAALTRGLSPQREAAFHRDIVETVGHIVRAGIQTPLPLSVGSREELAGSPYGTLLMPLLDTAGMEAFLAAPILFRDKIVGGLGVACPEPREWQETESTLVQAIGTQIGATLQRLRLLQALQRTNAALEEALRAKDEMIQNVSHELRTPLTIILGYAELLSQGVEEFSPEDIREMITAIVRNGHRLRFMIDRLILMRIISEGELHREPIRLHAWLREVVADWAQRAQEEDIHLAWEVADETLTVPADPRLLREVIDNLLDNAFKFSPDKGTVSLRAWREGDEARIAVQDEGIGIPPEKLEKVFERFYQVSQGLRRQYEGLGLGLALCKDIIDLHGGRIWAESEGEGKGATFHIALPV